jgi:regulation of enolase protein 1 (concanavalin A-like superfamily)
MTWLNEPPAWNEQDGVLTVTTGDRTDFWLTTHYGFVHDDGHVYGREVEGDFAATVEFSADYQALYDQAGLMVRLDERNWIKAGIEFTDGKHHLSVVVTRDFSDWSVLPLAEAPSDVRLRISRYGDAVRVEYDLGQGSFQMLRLAYLPPGGPAFVGPMCCSPQRAGLLVTFRDFTLGEPARELHA